MRPTLICCKTVIGCGAPTKAGGHAVHGAPLGTTEIAAMRAAKGWAAAPFEVPPAVAAAWDARAAGQVRTRAWHQAYAAYREAHPALAVELLRCNAGALPDGLAASMAALLAAPGPLGQKVATRKASQLVLEHLSGVLPELFGGSADLTSSNLTDVKASVWLNHAAAPGAGNYLSYGVREFGMAAVMNGVALHGGAIPYGGTFMAFSDYSRNAIRMAALMKLRVIHVLTHDSIGLGEDGPTHQPVEHAASLRLIPNNRVWRPCDGVETALAWQAALQRADGPTCLVLTRQALDPFARDAAQLAGVARGGYVLGDCERPQLVLVATGSEVGIAAQAARLLTAEGRRVRLVSLPCVELFYAQDAAYREAVLPAGVPRVSVEAGVTWFWRAVVGEGGVALGVDSFGESAPAEQLYEHFGLTPAHVAAAARALLDRPAAGAQVL
jgi:transketolase